MIWKLATVNSNYSISSTGLVKNNRTGRILKPWLSDGYEVVRFNKGGKSYRVHRLVALSFLDQINGLTIINHKNGIRNDNRVENLEWCNKSYNLRHAIETGLCPAHLNKIGHKDSVGSKNAMSKLDENDIKQIRKLRKEGLTLKQISVKFNVHFATIGYIIQGKTWSHV